MMRLCAVEGCRKKLVARGYCAMHYHRWKRHGAPGAAGRLIGLPRETCIIDGCGEPSVGLGYCVMHYLRLKRHGDPGLVAISDE